MATKTTKAPAKKAPPKEKTTKDPASSGKGKGNRTASGDIFKFVERPEGAKKLAPQAGGIVDTIEAAGDKGVTRAKLVEALGSVLTTRQPVERILTYYQKPLIDGGFISVEKASPAEPAKKEESAD